MLPLVSLPKLDHIPEPTSILIPTNLESEPPIFDNHIPLMGKECESQFLDLDSTFKPKLTLESKFELNHIPESVLVLIPIIQEPKSSIPQSHIPLLDQVLDQYDFVMISQDWSYNQEKILC